MTIDIKNTYHVVTILEQYQLMHRRDIDISKDPDTYTVTSVSSEDRPSGNIATIALRKTAKMILKNAQVDDIVNSVKDRDKANNLVRQAKHILNYGRFAVKHQTVSGCDESPNEKSDQVISSGETFKAITGGQNLFKGMEKAEKKVLGLG